MVLQGYFPYMCTLVQQHKEDDNRSETTYGQTIGVNVIFSLFFVACENLWSTDKDTGQADRDTTRHGGYIV